MANGDDRKLVPDPDEDALERGRRNLMLRNAGYASRPLYAPAELTAPAPPEAPELVAAPPERMTTTPRAAPPPPKTTAERLEERESTLESLLPSWKEQNWKQRLGTIAQTAGNVLVPKVMMNVPGTILNRRLELENVRKALGEEEERQSLGEYRKAQLPKISAEAEKDLAEAAKARAETGGPKRIPGAEGIATNEDTQEQLIGYSYPGGGERWVKPGTIPPASITPAPAPAPGVPGATIPGVPAPMGAPLPTPAAPAGLPPGFQIGTGKPSVAGEREKFIKLYNKAGRTPEEENYVQAHLPEFETMVPVGKAKADQMMGEIAKMPGIDPGIYAIAPGTSLRDANGLMTQARQASELNRQTQAPYVAQKLKDAHTYGYADDPSGMLELTNKAQADEWGHQFEEVSKADQYKDRVAIGQLNDIQQNTTRYVNAVKALPGAISTIHAQNMATILNDDKIKSGISMGILGRFEVPGGDFIADILKDTDKAHLWNDGLNDAERNVLSAYIRAKSSAFMFQRAIGSITRLPGELLKLELDNLPVPYVGWKASEPRFRDWQENIDLVTRRFPHNLPGAPHPEEIRRQLENAPLPGAAPGAAPPAAPRAAAKPGAPKSFKDWKQQQGGGTP
ncbi:MAG TPA: hypothetical protein VF772_01035 [Terriglobales bacterium]